MQIIEFPAKLFIDSERPRLRSEPSNFASVETIALHIGEVPASAMGARRRRAPGPAAGPIGAAWHRPWSGGHGAGAPGWDVAVEPSLSMPVPAQPHVGEVRRACVAQKHACLLEEDSEVADKEVTVAASAAAAATHSPQI